MNNYKELILDNRFYLRYTKAGCYLYLNAEGLTYGAINFFKLPDMAKKYAETLISLYLKEWSVAQIIEAAEGANFFLKVDSAKQYGLIEGGDDINVDRCLYWVQAAEIFSLIYDKEKILLEYFEHGEK